MLEEGKRQSVERDNSCWRRWIQTQLSDKEDSWQADAEAVLPHCEQQSADHRVARGERQGLITGRRAIAQHLARRCAPYGALN